MIHCIGKILLDIFEERRGGSVELSSKVGGAPFNVVANIALYGGKSSFYGAKRPPITAPCHRSMAE